MNLMGANNQVGRSLVVFNGLTLRLQGKMKSLSLGKATKWALVLPCTALTTALFFRSTRAYKGFRRDVKKRGISFQVRWLGR